MSAPAPQPDLAPTTYTTSDMRLVVTLMVKDVPILRAERRERKVIFHFDPQNAQFQSVMEALGRSDPIAVPDIDLVFDKLNKFQGIVHNYGV